jgi:hypothetical protein
MNEQDKAPGCYGAASVFSTDSEVCQACVAYAGCGDASLQTLEAIKNMVDVRDILKRHAAARAKARPTPTPAPKPVNASPHPTAQPAVPPKVARSTAQDKVEFALTADMTATIARIAAQNKKAADQATTLCKAGRITEARAMLPQGVNPFTESGPAYLRVVCDMLLSGGFTRSQLRVIMAQKLQWTEETAASHISLAIAILGAFRIVGKDGDRIVLHPALG